MYTRQQILELLKNNTIHTIKDFREKYPAVYLWYTRHRTDIGALPLLAKKKPNGSLTKESCAEVAKRFMHRSDFQKQEKGAYLKAHKEGFLDEICAHMTKKPHDPSTTRYVLENLKGKPAKNRIDLTGKTFNSWKIIGINSDKTDENGIYWNAVCLECNKSHVIFGAHVRNGTSKRCTSCGNLHGHNRQKGQIRTSRTPIESAHYYLYLRLRKDAKKRGLEWKLSEEQVYELVTKNCNYCGVEPSLSCNPLKYMSLSQKVTSDATILRNGIDRIDSSKGYLLDNTVSCCQTCNKAKLDMPKDDFIAWAIRLAKHQGHLK